MSNRNYEATPKPSVTVNSEASRDVALAPATAKLQSSTSGKREAGGADPPASRNVCV